MSDKYVRSCLSYTGSKFKLLDKLYKEFPKDYSTFVDVFSGALNVSLNLEGNKSIIANDGNVYQQKMFQYLYDNDIEDTMSKIKDIIKEWNFENMTMEEYIKFRDYYNENKDTNPLLLLCITFRSHNGTIRFNKNWVFNKHGNTMKPTQFKIKLETVRKFIERVKKQDIVFTCGDYRDMLQAIIDADCKDVFVYNDSPYLLTSYFDYYSGWTEKEEIKLYNLLDKLNEKGIKWAVSNCVTMGDKTNEILKEWSKKYNVVEMDFTYNTWNASKKRENNNLEVLVKNY